MCEPSNTLKRDLTKGLNAEKARQSEFEKVFGKMTKTGEFDNFDWKVDGRPIYVEHKERDIKHDKYPTLFFDKIKMDKYHALKRENADNRAFMIWSCLDGSYVWEYPDSLDDCDADGNMYFYFESKRMDRRNGKGWQPQNLVNVYVEDTTPIEKFDGI